MIWRWRARSSASAASSTPQSIEYGSRSRAEKSRAPDFAAFAAFAASAAHLGAVSAERRDSVRNIRTSSRRQVRPSRNLSQNVYHHQIVTWSSIHGCNTTPCDDP